MKKRIGNNAKEEQFLTIMNKQKKELDIQRTIWWASKRMSPLVAFQL